MAHQAHESYSATNPVPKLNPVDTLKRAIHPKKAEQHKLEKNQSENHTKKTTQSDAEKSQQSVGHLEPGREIQIVVSSISTVFDTLHDGRNT